MSEERLERIESLLERNTLQLQQNTYDIAEVRLALVEFRDTMQIMGQSITELRESAAILTQNQRSLIENVGLVNNTVERLATEAAQDRAAIVEMQAEVRQIWEYLLQQRGNGRSE